MAREIKALKEKRHRKTMEGLRNPGTPLQFEQRYFVSFPTNKKVHPTENVAVMSRRVHLIISQKIEILVKEGITDAQVGLCLKLPALCYAGNSWKCNYYASRLRRIVLTLCSCDET